MNARDWRARAGTVFEIEKRPVSSARGMVVTNHPLASAAGAEMLAGGGNAVDAAVASLFALTVVAPMMAGVFGAGHAQLFMPGRVHTVLDHGMSLQVAVEAPRVWTQGQDLEVEMAMREDVRAGLAARGHRVVSLSHVAGGMDAIAFEDDGTLTGASCWRADGSPVGIGGGYARPGIRFWPDARR